MEKTIRAPSKILVRLKYKGMKKNVEELKEKKKDKVPKYSKFKDFITVERVRKNVRNK